MESKLGLGDTLTAGREERGGLLFGILLAAASLLGGIGGTPLRPAPADVSEDSEANFLSVALWAPLSKSSSSEYSGSGSS